MNAEHSDLHGNAPDSSPVALMVIDMINDLEFPGGEKILESAVAVADRISALKARARAARIPVIYANDNFGRWRSDFNAVIEHCLHNPVRGRPLVQRLRPEKEDYFVLKPKHSAFFATTLETLLEYLECERLILTGITGDICVLFTASDAYLRDYELYVPRDCLASISDEENERAIDYMKRVHHADVSVSEDLDLEALRRGAVEESQAGQDRESHAAQARESHAGLGSDSHPG
jgi:nicotinamidase-related amidase